MLLDKDRESETLTDEEREALIPDCQLPQYNSEKKTDPSLPASYPLAVPEREALVPHPKSLLLLLLLLVLLLLLLLLLTSNFPVPVADEVRLPGLLPQ